MPCLLTGSEKFLGTVESLPGAWISVRLLRRVINIIHTGLGYDGRSEMQSLIRVAEADDRSRTWVGADQFESPSSVAVPPESKRRLTSTATTNGRFLGIFEFLFAAPVAACSISARVRLSSSRSRKKRQSRWRWTSAIRCALCWPEPPKRQGREMLSLTNEEVDLKKRDRRSRTWTRRGESLRRDSLPRVHSFDYLISPSPIEQTTIFV